MVAGGAEGLVETTFCCEPQKCCESNLCKVNSGARRRVKGGKAGAEREDAEGSFKKVTETCINFPNALLPFLNVTSDISEHLRCEDTFKHCRKNCLVKINTVLQKAKCRLYRDHIKKI